MEKGFLKLQRRQLVHLSPAERLFRLTEHEGSFPAKQTNIKTTARKKRIGFLIGMTKFGKAGKKFMEHCSQRTALLKLFLPDAATVLKGRRWKTQDLFPDDTFWCMQCRQRFVNKAGLSVHFFKKHGRKAGYRQYVNGTACRA